MNIKNINMSKKNIQISIIIILIVIIGLVGSYAWFTWSSTNNTSVTLSIGELADVMFNTGNDINIDNLSPVYNYTDGEYTTFSITNKDTTGIKLMYTVSIDIDNIDTELVSKDFKYKLLSGDKVVGEGNFSTASNGSSIKVGSDILSSGKTSLILYLYIDGNEENNSNMMNKVFSGKINVNVTEGDLALSTLTNLGLEVDTSHTPDFTTVSGNSGIKYVNGSQTATGLGDNTNGIYEAEDDLGTSYYFRGNVDNNYVYFANLWWRIIRINGDGTIRMIYAPSTSDYEEHLVKTQFNSDSNDNAYVGYMYGTEGSSTYADTHKNTNNSEIKAVTDEWYQNNLSSYSQYIADAIYCNDREVVTGTFGDTTYSGNGSGTSETVYASLKRNFIDHNPTLKCTNTNDRFTTSSSLGNGALTYPIGLITTDEVVMGGGNAYDYNTSSSILNDSYYLYSGYSYWTMTPSEFYGGDAYADGVGDDGIVYFDVYVSINGAARPVVTLISNAISGGDGTSGNPFYVGSAPSSSYIPYVEESQPGV